MTHPITMSALPRLEKCAASGVLPRSQSSSVYADAGTAKHLYLALVPFMGREAALAQVERTSPEMVAACADINLDSVPTVAKGEYAQEVSFALDPLTGRARELGRMLGRNYSAARPSEIPGTPDAVGINEEEVLVADYKGPFAELPPLAENLQLLAGALAAARTYGRDRARIATIRLGEDGEPWVRWATLDAMDLDAAELRVLQVVARVQEAQAVFDSGKTPETTAGRWCRYCPAFNFCPANTGLVRHLADNAPEVPQLFELTEDNAGAIWARLEQAEAVLAKVRASLEAYAERTPILLPGGDRVGLVENHREHLIPDVAEPLLKQLYGESVAQAAVVTKKTLTKEALKAALKEWAKTNRPDAKMAPLEREALGALRQGNAVSTSVTTTVKRFTPKRQLGAGEAA